MYLYFRLRLSRKSAAKFPHNLGVSLSSRHDCDDVFWVGEFCGEIFVLHPVRRTRVRRGVKTEIVNKNIIKRKNFEEIQPQYLSYFCQTKMGYVVFLHTPFYLRLSQKSAAKFPHNLACLWSRIGCDSILNRRVLWRNLRSSRREAYKGTLRLENGDSK